jgi:multimeric flavodoxin WrbA
MVTIAGIVGSPRRDGNTEIIMGEILSECRKAGASTELLRLADFNLNPCKGCRECYETKQCVIKDDVEVLFNRMASVDGFIVGSPVYFFNVSAQTKTFIDRIGYLNNARDRQPFRNKIGGAVVVAGRQGSTSAISEILLFLSHARIIVAAPFVTALASQKGDVARDSRGMEQARELANSAVQLAELTSPLRKTVNKVA